MITFNNSISQTFPFCFEIMDYITMMACKNGKIIQKLHKCCKYFYLKMDFTILDDLTIVPPYHGTTNNDGVVVEPDFFEKIIVHPLTLIFPTTEEDLSFLKDNLIILDFLFIIDYLNPSKIFSKIVLCQAAGLYIDCEITMEELKALINPDFATSLFLGDRVYYSNTNALVLPEEIFGLGPKLNSIHYVFLNK